MSNGSRVTAVLGVTGCVGRQVRDAFQDAGYDVLGVARHPAPHAACYPFTPLDLSAVDPAELAALLDSQRVDVIINATGGWVLPDEAMELAHVRLVERLVAAIRLMSRRPRLVHVGSIHEYGPVPFGVSIDETVPPNPTTSYARTKLAGSQTVLDATRAGVVDGVVLRVVNVCGPHTTEASFLGAFAAKLRATTPADGLVLNIADARRDYIDVRDLADAVVKAAEAPVVGEVLNIGRGEAVQMRDLVLMLCAAAGFPPEALTRQDGQVQSKGGGWTQADIGLARRLLGWFPRIGLQDSMRSMWTMPS